MSDSSKLLGKVLEVDYLVIGAGAMGMAFADTLLMESNATVAMIDRHVAPGGHWNDAYSYVRLHAPSAFYGVNSRQLGNNTVDQSGLNKGLYEQASAAEIAAYYDLVMRKQFLPTGRMHYFPMCNYIGANKFVSLVSGAEYQVSVRKKMVDATYTDTTVPATHTPQFYIDPASSCLPPNKLQHLKIPYAGYVVIGSGKTGIDACLWLLEHQVPASQIRWIMPRDPWLMNRTHIQPGGEFFQQRAAAVAFQLELIRKADSIEHLFQLLSDNGQLLRIDDSIRPSMYRCATVTQAELDVLRQIKNIMRFGRVRRIEPDRIVLDDGTIATGSDILHIDCSAHAISRREAVPVFDGERITLQSVRTCQQCFSSALIAHVELSYTDEAEKNRICAAIPLPDRSIDWLRMQLANLTNQYCWSKNSEVRTWIANSRLDVNRNVGKPTAEDQLAMQRFRENAGPATARLKELLAGTAT